MLSLMRKHAGTWLIKVILGAIVIVFIFWGVGSYTSRRSGRVARVNGKVVTLDEYNATYNNLIERFRQQFGNNLDAELLKTFQLKRQALDQLIDKNLLLQGAAELNLRVTDAELAQSIRNISAFQTAGVFDNRLYQNLLNLNKMTPDAFEVSQREAILIEKLREVITSSVKVSDLEALEWFKWNNATVNLDYVLFDPQRYQDIIPSSDELVEFFGQNKDSYKTEPQVKVQYIKFEPQTYASRVEISDDEIQEYYELHPEEFQTAKTVEARHILIKVDQDADPETVAQAKEKILDVLKMAKEGKDFAELARQYSEDASKDQGGYLGTFEKEAMVKPFSDQAFAMQAGEISEPVRTRFGWHLIKVEKVNAAATQTLAEAENAIRKRLTDERSQNMAYDEAQAAYDSSFEGASLEKLAADHDLEIQATDFFTRQGPETGIQNRPQFAAAAFDLADDEISEVQDLGDGYYLLRAVAKLPAETPELKTVEAKVKADLIRQKQEEKARQEAEALREVLTNQGQSLAEAGKEFGVTPASTGFFKRNDTIPDIGLEREIAQVAFTLSDTHKLPDRVLKGQKGYYVIQFKERRAPALDDFDQEKVDIKNRLLRQKQFKTFQAWLAQKKEQSEISIEEEFVE
ncbi:MAG: SurA N-terminal domain-containing protein [Desulfobacterales bacterium]|nr:MAG: SurA N-terminal domain-containing protein [Desulfobacterales bacterium]